MDGASRDGGHVDEGTIHAWLDDGLDAASAARVASHVESCPECAAAVAEARGLIAGASRVVRALDDETVAPAAGPEWGAAPAASSGSLWRVLRVTPARAAIAATLLVALGVTLTYPRTGLKETAVLERHASAISAPQTATAAVGDALLDSAVKRNLATAQPQRTVEAAPGPAIPTAPGPGENAAKVDAAAPALVAEGRATVRQMRETSAPAADQSRTYGTVPPGKEAVVAPMAAAEAAGAVVHAATAAECYRVESATPGTTWGTVPLPFVVGLQPTAGGAARGGATILDPTTGSSLGATALWSRRAGDTLQLDLRRIGYTGQLMLAAGAEERSGTMRSALVPSQLEAVVATGVASRDDSSGATPKKAMARARVLARPKTAAPVMADSTTGVDVAHGVPIAAKRVSCP